MKKIITLSILCLLYSLDASARLFSPAEGRYVDDEITVNRPTVTSSNDDDDEYISDGTGTYYRKIGNSYYGNDGSVYTRTGNQISGSNGRLYEISGSSIYESGRERCRRRGNYLECD